MISFCFPVPKVSIIAPAMKKLLLIISLSLFAGTALAQEYDQSIGLRLGFANGITYKKSLDGISAIEVLGSFKQRATTLTALYEVHFYAFDTDNLYLFLGVGAHIGVVSPVNGSNTLLLGADGIGGIEYAFDEVPLAFSLDLKPAINISGGDLLDLAWLGLSGRYTF